MRHFVFTVGVLALSLQASRAAPICATGTLASYIALGSGGCSLGSAQFDSFQTIPGISFSNPINPTAVTVAPTITGNDASLTFNTSSSVTAMQIAELIFSYRLVGGVTGSMITLSNARSSGDGLVTDIQNLCEGGMFGPDGVSGCYRRADNLVAIGDGGEQAAFPSVSLLNVTDDFTLDGGLRGSASGGTFVDKFTVAAAVTATPEPGTLLAMSLGLLSLAAFKFAPGKFRINNSKESK